MHNHTENVLLFYDCHVTESNLMAILDHPNYNGDRPATFSVLFMFCHAVLGSISCYWLCSMVFAKENGMAGAGYVDMSISEYSHSFSYITFR